MGLVQRGGCLYYQESIRRGGKVHTRYVGSGLLAVLAARLDAERREDEAAQRRAMRMIVAEVDEVAGVIGGAAEAARARAHAELEARGWHQHKREWRRRRGPRS